MKNHLVLIAALAALCSLPVAANAAAADRGNRAFSKADKDNDGKVTKEEFIAATAGKTDKAKAEKAFARKDKNHDGSLTKEEFGGAATEPKKDGEATETPKRRKKDK